MNILSLDVLMKRRFGATKSVKLFCNVWRWSYRDQYFQLLEEKSSGPVRTDTNEVAQVEMLVFQERVMPESEVTGKVVIVDMDRVNVLDWTPADLTKWINKQMIAATLRASD